MARRVLIACVVACVAGIFAPAGQNAPQKALLSWTIGSAPFRIACVVACAAGIFTPAGQNAPQKALLSWTIGSAPFRIDVLSDSHRLTEIGGPVLKTVPQGRARTPANHPKRGPVSPAIGPATRLS